MLTRLYIDFQMLKGSKLRSQWWNPAEIRTHLRLNSCPPSCMNEEDLIKNEGARVLTRLYTDFSDALGQLTPQSVVESG